MKRAIRLTGSGGHALGAAIAGALSPLVTFGMVRLHLAPEAGGALLEIEGAEAHVEEAVRMAEAMIARVGEPAEVDDAVGLSEMPGAAWRRPTWGET